MNEWAGASAFVIAKAPSFARFGPLFSTFRRVRFFRFTVNVLRLQLWLFISRPDQTENDDLFFTQPNLFRYLRSFHVAVKYKELEEN
jgi:hypothetical protein